MVSRPLPSVSNQRGAILIIASVALMGVFVITGLVFNFGFWFVTRSQLQQIADTTALAGGRVLGTIYSGGNNPTPPLTSGRKLFLAQQNYPQDDNDDTDIFNVLNAIAMQHRAGGVPISIATSDVEVGTWNYPTNGFTVGTTGTLRPNAVRVTVRRDTTANGSLGTTFGRLLGVNSFSLTATATAALTPIIDVPPNDPGTPAVFIPAGQIEFPLGIDADYLGGNFCPNPEPTCNSVGVCIDLSPLTLTLPTCTAWNTFDGPAGDWGGIIAGNITSPQTTTGDMYNFGGAGEAAVAQLSNLYDNLEAVTPTPGGFRETLLPVYAANGCIPPGPGNLPIVGFVNARIFALTGNAIFVLRFACDVVSTGRSGGLVGQDFGTFGSIPVLVQ